MAGETLSAQSKSEQGFFKQDHSKDLTALMTLVMQLEKLSSQIESHEVKEIVENKGPG